MLGVLSFLAVVFGVNSATVSFITPCKTGDSACVLQSTLAAMPIIVPGIPELGIKSLDPLFLELVQGDTAGLQLTLMNTTVIGLKDCKVENIKHDLAKMKQSIVLRCTLHLNGDYKLDGRVLILPIKGEGKYVIDIRDVVVKASTELEIKKGEDGKDHWHIKGWKHSYNTKGGAYFDFQNLFNGNKVLAAPVLEFLNTNWVDIMREIAPPIVRAVAEAVVYDVEALYKAVPAEELSAD